MSKGKGQKVTLQFTEELRGDVTGMDPHIAISDLFFTPSGIATAFDFYSSTYVPSKAFDGGVNTYFYSRTVTNWIKIELQEALNISGFQWTTEISSYKPKDFEVFGSNDGDEWTLLYADTSPNINYWNSFGWKPKGEYKFYKWNINTGWGGYLYINEIKLRAAGGNESAMYLTGTQYRYVHGPLDPTRYMIESVEFHPIFNDKRHLLLTLHPQSRFNNVEENLTLRYEMSEGSLRGRGGFVQSFITSFLPTDLETKPNPGIREYIIIQPLVTVGFIQVDYHRRMAGDTNLNIDMAVAVTLTYVGIINP